MRKKIMIAGSLSLLLIISNSFIVEVAAQEDPKSCRVYCPDGTSHLVPCNTNVDPCTGGNLTPNRNSKGMLSSPLGSALSGGVSGLLLGSLLRDINGQNQWATGAALGGGSFMLMSLATSSKNWSPGKKLAVAVVGSAVLGVGGAMAYNTYKTNTNNPPEKKTENIAIGSAGTVALVVVPVAIFGGFKNKDKLSTSYKKRKYDFFSNMLVGMSRKRMSILVRL